MNRILILCEYPSLNGGERSLLAMLDHVKERHLDLVIAGPADGPLAETVRDSGIRFVPLSLHDTQGRRWALETCRERILEIIESIQPAIIHANSLSMSRLVGPVALDQRIASVGHLRDMIKVNASVIRDLSCNTRLLAVSDATRRWYVGLGADIGKIHVLLNGVDLQDFQPRPASGFLHRELAIPAASPLIATIGQIGMRKGMDVFVAAAAEIAASRSDVHFVIVGRRYSQKQEALEYEARLHRATATERLRNRCHWLDLRHDVPLLMNELTLLVHAARQEPLGRVLLESAAAGLPCVATDVGGTAEVFPGGTDTALLVPPDDPHAVVEQALRLLDDTALRHRIASNARRRAEQAFNSKSAAARLYGHYASVLTGNMDR